MSRSWTDEERSHASERQKEVWRRRSRADRHVISVAMSKGQRRGRSFDGVMTSVLIGADYIDRLQHHASKRVMTAPEICRRLIEEVVDGNLIDAVLDDQG